MRKSFLIVFLCLAIESISQTDSQLLEGRTRQKLFANDSALARLRRFDDSISEDIHKKDELKQIEQMAQNSADYFVRMQKERRAKEKRNAIIRIGIGIAFLIVLIFGLRRRIKK